jgi:hypothetical protein
MFDDRLDEDPAREERITMEIIVDCYDSYEQAAGWHCSLEDRLHAPFQARCLHETSRSPLRPDETVTVLGMADADECDMAVMIAWGGREFGVPLAQLEPIDADEETETIVGDWHYWVGRGYRLC